MINKEHLIDAVICREKDTILGVSRIIRDTQRRHLLVLDNKDFPIGIISTVDINNRVLAEEKDPKQTKAEEIMTRDIKIVSIEDSYEKAFKIMAELGTPSIPVLNNGKLFGLLEFNQSFKLKEKRCV